MSTEFIIYETRVNIEVVRRTGRYDSDPLANITTNEQFPLALDIRLENLMTEVNTRVEEAARKIETVLLARGEFDRKVQLAIGPPDIEGEGS